MAEATVTTESGYLEMFAAFFVGASEAEAHYYSIKPLHKAIPGLARRLGVSQDNFQALLVASGLGSLRKNGQFIFKKNRFDSFLNKNKVQGTCELVYRQPKGFGNQHWFVKVGTKLGIEAPVPGAKGIGAQIRNIRSLRASFRDEVLTKASAWMTSARMNQEILLSNERLSDYEDGGQPEDGNEYENDLMLSRIKTKLLPLLLKEEVLEMNFWTTVNSARTKSRERIQKWKPRLHSL
jgi:hypothetical protein